MIKSLGSPCTPSYTWPGLRCGSFPRSSRWAIANFHSLITLKRKRNTNISNRTPVSHPIKVLSQEHHANNRALEYLPSESAAARLTCIVQSLLMISSVQHGSKSDSPLAHKDSFSWAGFSRAGLGEA
jgi:hypothetical protein